MRRFNPAKATVDELVGRFAEIGVEQNKALFDFHIAKFNRLYDRMEEICEELRNRPGDQRRALSVLFSHPDLQVRLKAAHAMLAIAPRESRHVIETIAASRRYPQAGDAGMTLRALDDGTYVPR